MKTFCRSNRMLRRRHNYDVIRRNVMSQGQKRLTLLPSFAFSHTHTRAHTHTHARTHAHPAVCTGMSREGGGEIGERTPLNIPSNQNKKTFKQYKFNTTPCFRLLNQRRPAKKEKKKTKRSVNRWANGFAPKDNKSLPNVLTCLYQIKSVWGGLRNGRLTIADL